MAGNTSPIIGIDLGTSNSAVAWFAEGNTQLIPGAQGERLTPLCYRHR
ncbi:Hsp70 protein [Kosakonia sacchari]|nr:Hsp70 protein [Kosakonia sacchari]